jgi:hypothetical protein
VYSLASGPTHQAPRPLPPNIKTDIKTRGGTTPSGREDALVVLTVTLDAPLDLCLRLIAAAGRLRAHATRS